MQPESALYGEHRQAVSKTKGLKESALDKFMAFTDMNHTRGGLSELFQCLSILCGTSNKRVILLIDEVDSATNNQVFLDFLAQLRGYYIQRDEHSTFHSVVLAGVYSITVTR